MVKQFVRFSACLMLVLFAVSGCAPKPGEISGKEKKLVKQILKHWETWVPAVKKKGQAPLINFEDLYEGLNAEQKAFLEKVRTLKQGGTFKSPGNSLTRISGQVITVNGEREVLDPQYLPRWSYEAYQEMMLQMHKDTGKELLIESGYRSPAYQLYLFIYYLAKHKYSITETRRWVALPGHSEHGDPDRQAIDFISLEGVNGDSDRGQTAADFEKIPEYGWLQKNAGRYGFELSYPKKTPENSYEPWHWRFVRNPAERQGAQ